MLHFIWQLVCIVPILISVAFMVIVYKVECSKMKDSANPKSVKSSITSLTLKEVLTLITILICLMVPILNIIVTWGIVVATNERYDIMDLTCDEMEELFTADAEEKVDEPAE